MKTFLLVLLFTVSAQAERLYFNGSMADGTDKFANVTRTEFLFDASTSRLRLCGYWMFADGTHRAFDQSWDFDGANVSKDGNNIGTYYEGNFFIAENVGGKNQIVEINRSGPEWFDYQFHHPDFGFVNADGLIVKNPSSTLTNICN